MANSTLSSTTKKSDISHGLAASSLMGAGVPQNKDSKDTKKSE